MTYSSTWTSGVLQSGRILTIVFFVVLLAASDAHSQTVGASSAAPGENDARIPEHFSAPTMTSGFPDSWLLERAGSKEPIGSSPIEHSALAASRSRGLYPKSRAAAFSAASSIPKRSTRHKVAGAVLGAVVGFPLGGFLGSKVEGDSCHCADRGLGGFIIGAQVGAVTGAILGLLSY